MKNTTIAAIATPHGTGGISVIRVSGEESISICDKIFKAKSNKTLTEAKTHTIHYGNIIANGDIIDEVLVSVMRAPNTFTREDIVEINCHGGLVVTEKVLLAVISAGASLASPGEFTKRAFLNGRIDLSQAEAVIDIINSPSSLALSVAANQLGGALSDDINKMRDSILEILAQINVVIDYPEEDIDDIKKSALLYELNTAKEKISTLLETSHRGKLIKDGINTVICGKPNVGKSSILNLLARDSRAIVTDIAGTTRDVIEERITIGNAVLNVSDTAGIRNTTDAIENLGIDKSKECIKNAELVLFVVDSVTGIETEDREIFDSLDNKNVIVILNKSDITNPPADKMFDGFTTISLSAKTGDGLEELSSAIEKMFKLGEIRAKDNNAITNLRHKEALCAAYNSISAAIDALDNNIPYDMVSIDLTDCASHLGEITGKTVSDEIVDKIFSRFCLGK
jgi:tRNA modification GTPase